MSPRAQVDGHQRLPLDEGWSAAASEPDAHPDPGAIADLAWSPAHVPGTAAGVLRAQGVDPVGDLDAKDWWFRTRFDAQKGAPDEEVVLGLDGIATVAEVYLNGERILESGSMFARHEIEVGDRLRGDNELAIRCRALAPLLGLRRTPRARWRTRLVSDGNLRWFRTMILGRAPGFAPRPAAVGPWRPVWLERRRRLVVEELALRPRLDGGTGVLAVRARLRPLPGLTIRSAELEVSGPAGVQRAFLELSGLAAGQIAQGELRITSVRPWWPHTHGEAALYDVRLLVESTAGTIAIQAGRVGFRSLTAGPSADRDIERDGLDLHINGVRVFARGAVWTPVDPVGLAPSAARLRTALETVRAAGMNMVRVPGTAAYEQDEFHDLCDELGILVWQDFMFANLDYPFVDDDFRGLVEDEARQVLGSLAGRPSLAVLCGNSEIEQQVAMLGLDPAIARAEFFGTTLPGLARAAGVDAVYVPSAPCGGDLPFRPDQGIANYYGVGAYLRPLADARAAGVRFAAECLAFANVPDEAVLDQLEADSPGALAVNDPRWKAGVPRDAGADWDFDDVRDHYLGLLFGVHPAELRSVDPERYLELSRSVSGEVMAEVFGEWRRSASPCGGGLVLSLGDLVPGAGWGVLDHRGEPKVAYHHLRRALAPLAVWTTDEGLGGVIAHVANDGPSALTARLRVTLYQDHELRVGEGIETIDIGGHGAHERNIETLVGHFVDAAWAYRFGPPAQDLIVASVERDGETGTELLAQSFRFPAGRPTTLETAAQLGLEGAARTDANGSLRLAVQSRRLAYGVRVHVPGFRATDDAFSVEPGGTRSIDLHALEAGATFKGGTLTALNLSGRVAVAVGEGAW